jgi:peptide/nickel transport system substrate-binding protein
MRRFRSPLFVAASAIAFGSVVAAVRPRYGGTLRVETQAALRTPDPAAPPADAADAAARARLLPLVFETLVTADPAGGLRPALAIAWDSDAQGTRWRFQLRPNARLHDGSRLDPAEVATALRGRDDGWRVSSTDNAIIIASDRARPDLPWELTDVRFAVSMRRPSGDVVGTGPFRVERLEAGRLSLRAHGDYWGGRPFVDAVQIEMGVPPADQLTHLEVGRADIVGVDATDVRRVSQRGLRIVESRPLDLMALVFDVRRATPAGEPVRRALALAIDRAAMCTILLQRHAEPAPALLPEWLSGYAALLAVAPDRAQARAIVSARPSGERALTLRVDRSDSLAHAIAERVAVDAREAGLSIKVEAPDTLAPRPDARLVRVKLEATSPERALARAIAILGPRATALAMPDGPPEPGAGLADVYRFERALIERNAMIPVVHLPEIYAIGARVESWNGPMILPTGAWNLAGVWLGVDKP